MRADTERLAEVLAGTDAGPRLVRQFTALFLVTPTGDVWRVFDSDVPSGVARFTPTNDPQVCSRVFIGSGAPPVVRVYRFKDGEARSISAERMHDQLVAAKPGI